MTIRATPLLLLCGLGSSLSVSPALAESETAGPLRIEWVGPEECGPPEALERATRRLLGKLAESAAVDVAAEATRMEGAGYRIELRLSGAVSGTRSFESVECREALQAAAVVLALAINPDALLSPPRPTDAHPGTNEEKPPEQSPSPEPSAASPAPPEDPSRRKMTGFAQVAGRLGGGLVPFPGFGTEAVVGVDVEWIRVQGGGFMTPSVGEDLSPEGRATFLAFGGGADICFRGAQLDPLTARFCAGLWISSVRAAASGLLDATTQAALFYTPRALGELALRLHPNLSVVAAGGVQIPTTTVDFQVGEGPEQRSVHQVRVGGIGRLGFEFNF